MKKSLIIAFLLFPSICFADRLDRSWASYIGGSSLWFDFRSTDLNSIEHIGEYQQFVNGSWVVIPGLESVFYGSVTFEQLPCDRSLRYVVGGVFSDVFRKNDFLTTLFYSVSACSLNYQSDFGIQEGSYINGDNQVGVWQYTMFEFYDGFGNSYYPASVFLKNGNVWDEIVAVYGDSYYEVYAIAGFAEYKMIFGDCEILIRFQSVCGGHGGRGGDRKGVGGQQSITEHTVGGAYERILP